MQFGVLWYDPWMTRQPEILQQSVDETIAVLGRPRPLEGASACELEIWLEWWRPSLELARELAPDRVPTFELVATSNSGTGYPRAAIDCAALIPTERVQGIARTFSHSRLSRLRPPNSAYSASTSDVLYSVDVNPYFVVLMKSRLQVK